MSVCLGWIVVQVINGVYFIIYIIYTYILLTLLHVIFYLLSMSFGIFYEYQHFSQSSLNSFYCEEGGFQNCVSLRLNSWNDSIQHSNQYQSNPNNIYISKIQKIIIIQYIYVCLDAPIYTLFFFHLPYAWLHATCRIPFFLIVALHSTLQKVHFSLAYSGIFYPVDFRVTLGEHLSSFQSSLPPLPCPGNK